MLSEPNVKVVFHQTAVPVTPLSTWIIYPKRSALGHSTRCLAEAWLSEVDSIFSSRCRTCCPLRGGAGAAATWTPSFLLLSALSRAEPDFFILFKGKGRQSPKAAIPIGQRAERNEERPRQSYHRRGRKSVLPSDNTHPRPSSAFFVFDEKQKKISRSPKAFSFPRRPAPFRGENLQSEKRQRAGEQHFLLFSLFASPGSEKHSERAPR